MTLLRNNLRTEEKDKQQSGWLEGLLPRRGKGPAEPESSPANRGPREPEPATAGKKPLSGPHRQIPQPSSEAPSPAPKVAEKTAVLPVARTTTPARREETRIGQVSILRTLTIIAFCAIASVALMPGHEAWASMLLLMTVALLGVSLVAIPNCRQDRRAFWQGFAVFGCGYLLMAFVPSFPHQAGLELPTSRLVRLVHAKATASPEDPRDSFQIMRAAPSALPDRPSTVSNDDRPQSLASMVPASGNIKEFMIVGHCLFTLMAALVGSALAGWFYRTDLASSGQSGT